MADTQNSSGNENNKNEAFDSAERRANDAANRLDAKLSGPLAPLEKSLDDVFGSKAQYQLPENIKKVLVDIAPWLALVGGVLGILSAYNIWAWAHRANQTLDSLNRLYGDMVPRQTVELGLMFWVSIVMTLVFAALALLAFPGLKAKKKVGWNLMFYSMIANIAYGIVSLFYDGGGLGNLLSSLIVSAIGLYILFQVRSHYLLAK